MRASTPPVHMSVITVWMPVSTTMGRRLTSYGRGGPHGSKVTPYTAHSACPAPSYVALVWSGRVRRRQGGFIVTDRRGAPRYSAYPNPTTPEKGQKSCSDYKKPGDDAESQKESTIVVVIMAPGRDHNRFFVTAR